MIKISFMKKILSVVIGLMVVVVISIFFTVGYFSKKSAIKESLPSEISLPRPLPSNEIIQPLPDVDNVESRIASSPVVLSEQKVPFIVQAPLGNWSDPIFQNACEESSIVMAMNWSKGIEEISAQQAMDQIKDIVEFEDKVFGYNADTDLSDIEKIFTQYFEYRGVAVMRNIVMEDIINELGKGNLVIIPAFGQKLANPNFTAPGPVAHMLVVIGYDEKSKKFITNDPGTKKGAGYKYDEKVLFDSIWEYSSGEEPLNPPADDSRKKSMVIVSKK